MNFKKYIAVFSVVIFFSGFLFPQKPGEGKKFLTLTKEDLANGTYHLNHYKTFSKYASGYNLQVLKAVDSVQAHALDGGTYFIGVKAVPAESPVNYELKFGGKSLLTPPKGSSYCSGSAYAAFIESLNMILPDAAKKISNDRFEAIRMQEPDGGRREDWVKLWGIWNADGFGSQYAMVQYTNMGQDVKPEDAIPGDFANISWKHGAGHSVVILGWFLDEQGSKKLLFWSSQKKTNGYGDLLVSLDEIKEIKIVRLTKPENIYHFDIKKEVNKKVPGDQINWE